MEGAGRGQNNSHTLAIFDPQKVEARGNDGMNFRRSVIVWLSEFYIFCIFLGRTSGEIKEKFSLEIIIMCLIIMFLYSFLREKFGIPTGEILKILLFSKG